MKTNIVVFSGYNQRAVIAFLRTLSANNLSCFIIASSKDDPIFLTKYKKDVIATRKKKELDKDDIFKWLTFIKNKSGKEKHIIMPTTEALIRFLLDNRKIFKDLGFDMPIVNKSLYEDISDKYKFGSICSKYNIAVPSEYISLSEAKIPFVAKPKKYYSNDNRVLNPVLVYNKKDLDKFKNNYNKKDFYYQKFIKGKSFYLLYYFSKKGCVYKFSQENLIQQHDGKSIIAAISSGYHKQPESLKYEKMFKDLNFFGLVMIEVRKYRGINYMIEANPRFWGPSQLFVDANVNFFESFLHDQGFLEEKPNEKGVKKETRYFWAGGLYQVLKEGREIVCYGSLSKDIMKNISDWMSVDIYNRDDTKEIFKRDNNEIV